MPSVLPHESTGLRLGKIFADGRGLLCEAIRFPGGRDAVDTVLRRAAISGRVDIGGDIEDHFADVLDADASIIETVALDRRSYSALKNHWMRCKVEMVDPKSEPTHD
jgi:hypothetical protein